MQLTKTLFAAALVAGSVLASAASAITFDFTGTDLAPTSELRFSSGGIDLTVTAGTFSSASNPSSINFGSRNVDQDNNGLGAVAGGGDDAVDGANGNDVLVFTFSEAVVIEHIHFGEVDRFDDFAFGEVSGTSFDRVVNFQDISSNPFDLSGVSGLETDESRTFTSFGIGAIGGGLFDSEGNKFADNFFIKGLSLSVAPPSNEPPAVPLPASALLLLGGLGAFGIARRRKTQS